MDLTMIGKQIAALRKEKGVKQEELASFVGVTAQAVSKWENGGVPDTELIPKIADFFEISIDTLFGRSMTDYGDLDSMLTKKICAASMEERFELAFEYCWSIERALFGGNHKAGSIADYRRERTKKDQLYSSIQSDHGFTRMGIGNRLSYFLLVPEIEDSETALFEGIDYPALFKDLSDREVFDACVMLFKRDSGKAFTPGLLVKRMALSLDRATEIIELLKKYKWINTTHIEMDDETREVYTFCPTPSFVAMLIFAREMIDAPNKFAYYNGGRSKPYLK